MSKHVDKVCNALDALINGGISYTIEEDNNYDPELIVVSLTMNGVGENNNRCVYSFSIVKHVIAEYVLIDALLYDKIVAAVTHLLKNVYLNLEGKVK